MQAAAAPWRAVLRTTHLLVDPTRLAASSFHSTPVSSAKWKDKFDCKHEHGARKLSKNYERYVVRQKRAEGKKALKDYLLFGKSSPHLQGGSTGSFANSHDIPRFKTFRKGSQSHGSTKSRQGVHHHRKCKKDRERFYNFFREEYYVHPDKIFEDMFDFEGLVNRREKEFVAIVTMKMRMKQPTLGHMHTGLFLDYQLVVH
ncbi:hypothetical protein DAI22_04g318000 [Oryza sativa Japonica Group]|nr:hypothetical protein DAI22_04g318000 [Oryza sativa Japonica Group]